MQKYPVSKIAASSVILAINIYKLRELFFNKYQKQQESHIGDTDRSGFFKKVPGSPLDHAATDPKNKEDAAQSYVLNTDIWNNKDVLSLTQYGIEDIKDALYDLAKFVSENLIPNKLKYFEIEGIKDVKNFKSGWAYELENI